MRYSVKIEIGTYASIVDVSDDFRCGLGAAKARAYIENHIIENLIKKLREKQCVNTKNEKTGFDQNIRISFTEIQS